MRLHSMFKNKLYAPLLYSFKLIIIVKQELQVPFTIQKNSENFKCQLW